MKRAILSLILISCTYLWTGAQISISVSPGMISGNGMPTSPDIPAYCHITNNSAIPLSLLWTRVVVSAPEEWTSWVCDMNNCYLPHVSVCPESRPNVVDPGQSFELSMHAGPAGVSGVAVYKLYFYELENPSVMLDSVIATIETNTSSVTDLSAQSLRVYPNPTTSYFQINNPAEVASVAIYNIVGNKMREFDATSTTRFDVSDLTEGIYLVRLLDARHAVLKTVRLSKR